MLELPTKTNSKIVILTFEGNPIATDLYTQLSKIYEVLVVYTADHNMSIFYAFKRKRGVRWLFYNIIFKYASKKYAVGHIPEKSWEYIRGDKPSRFIKVDSHNSNECIGVLKQYKPDLGVLIGTVLIKPEVYNVPFKGMINLHQGKIPEYRGAPPAYWEHRCCEKRMFVTIHKVKKTFDSGEIFIEKSFSIENHEHFVVSKYIANHFSMSLIERAVQMALQNKNGKQVEIKYGTNTVPTIYLLMKEMLKLLEVGIK